MSNRKIAIVACGVLQWNIDRVSAHLPGVSLIKRILPAQLHNNPRRLREMLQEQIDELSADPEIEGICLGFGVCGRGTVNLFSRTTPLVIPRVQDCIGLMLGSHERYLSEFATRPGTKYMSQGWYETTVLDVPQESYMSPRDRSLYGTSFDELSERYGPANADFIVTFRESWRRNYQRAAYIRFPDEPELPAGQLVTEATASSLGWEHTVMDGDESLLHAMLAGNWSDSRLLVVPPRNQTVAAPGAIIGFTSGVTTEAEAILARYRQTRNTTRPERHGVGLGIDTGGTFTDAVIYDFDREQILACAKAPTTHHQLAGGIREVLTRLPATHLHTVSRVGISTTLATNAFVEKKGRPVALFVMSPFQVHLEAFPFRHVRKIKGAMTMEGVETEAIDPDQIRREAKAARDQGCEAFAFSGFAGVVDPCHEIAAAHIAYEATGLPAVCGHELTSHLNFIERATTAAMNAKLIPLVEALLQAVRQALAEQGLETVRVMVVKGDGSQMLDDVARQFPVETVLSGPAASVVGAARLFAVTDAVVADMGGTTLDVALIQKGLPLLSENGSRIGEFRTSVRGMAVRTIGLGGDSEIDLSGWPHVRIGPRRVIPVAKLTADHPGQLPRLDALLQTIVPCEANVLDTVTMAPGVPPTGRLLEHLADGPLHLAELAECMNRPGPAYLPWRDLEGQGKIVRYGLTLTDILHVQGSYTEYDPVPPRRYLQAWATLLDADPERLIAAIYHEFRRLVADEILATVLPSSCPWEDTEDGLRHWLTAHLAQTDPPRTGKARFAVTVDCPLIPVGAPTPILFPQLNQVLNQEIMISEYAGVANAFGAISGDVALKETAVIRITEAGAFLCSWRGGNARATSLSHALEISESALIQRLQESAAANRVDFFPPAFDAISHEAEARDGKLFLGVTLNAELRA